MGVVRRRAAVAIVIASALLFSACAGPVGAVASYDDAAHGAPRGEHITSMSRSPREVPPPSQLEVYLSRIFGVPLGETADDSLARLRADELVIEEEIAECMAAFGFEYHPVLLWAHTPWINSQPWEVTEEFAEMYGFGVSTQPFGPDRDSLGRPLDLVDPNLELLEAMSDAEREAWHWALWGGPSMAFMDALLEAGGEEWNAFVEEMIAEGDAIAGCANIALHRSLSNLPDQWDSLREELMWIAEIYPEDRLVAVKEPRVRCMDEK
ncbi:MAG: hypothetical protein FWG25_08590, partial [Promicromonosporaceae bacterium]|nr:hypothetical protein [Promicromonosporaceae bacterium]